MKVSNEDIRYVLLQHIDQVAVSSTHALCIEKFLRTVNVKLEHLDKLNKEVLQTTKDELNKYIFTMFGEFSNYKITITDLVNIFLANILLYTTPLFVDTIIQWYFNTIKTYLLNSVRYHLNKEHLQRLDNLAKLIQGLLFNVEKPDDFVLVKQWEVSANKNLIERVIDCVSITFNNRVNTKTLLINFSHTDFTLLLEMIDRMSKDIKSADLLKGWYLRYYLVYNIFGNITLQRDLKLQLKDITTNACLTLSKKLPKVKSYTT